MGLPDGLLVPLNYDIIRTGRTNFGDWATLPRGTTGMKYFKWNKQIELLIFDEVQRCRGAESLTHKILVGSKLSGVPTIGLSATFGESPLDFRGVGYLSGWFDYYHFYNWVRRHNCLKTLDGKWKFVDKTSQSTLDVMKTLRAALMQRGSRIAIDDLGDAFPKNIIDTKLYRIGEASKLRKLYKEVADAFDKLRARQELDKDPEHGLTATLRERQQIELLKVRLMEEMVRDEIDQGRSVVVFCNFLLTIEALSKRLKDYDPAIITGAKGWEYDILRRPGEDTDSAVLRFQKNGTFLALAQSDTGGVGLGFHDLYGRPRTTIINPHWSAMVFRQILGRIHFEAFTRKAAHLHTLITDADLQPYAGFKPELIAA
jgi:hypothetical protein